MGRRLSALLAAASLTLPALPAGATQPPAPTDQAAPVARAPIPTAPIPYTCDFPVVGAQPVRVVVGADLPAAVPLGAPSDGFAVAAALTVPAEVTRALVLAGTSRFAGTARVDTAVTGPEGPRTVHVAATVAEVAVPADGELTVVATGTFPEQVLPAPGVAGVAIADITLSLAPDSAPGWAGVDAGPVEVPCAPDAGATTALGTTEVSAAVDWAAPTHVTVTATTSDSVTLSWTPPGGRPVTAFDVRRGNEVVTAVTTTTATVDGLVPGTEYTFAIQARDDTGGRSRTSDPVTARTNRGRVTRSYDIAAVTHNVASDVSVRFTGEAHADIDLSTGISTVDLSLHPTTVRVRLYGVLPVTATVAFEPGATTGTLSEEGLSVATRITIRLPTISVFGYPVSTGPSCRTSVPADITLHSDGEFDLADGGTLASTYTIPPLAGCGGMTATISTMAAGTGNTLDLTLTPPES
ncbi:fibronectin type III domain-containing protein [Actinokineospora sp. PR83]|uniref:fibronectin type III domain-containing protein n=1 Tax=Actinokineospora sp. PR83 TaxID=2884908 RepID=UPI001F3BF93F|nr:fibronectin type III domain-containing protein [Actinokineospora sp. PR83]MCG8920430.1 fibronectin type III domain-containing protein [Actinokineospora sp. PR83]